MKEKKSSYFTATWKMLAAVIIGGIAGGVSVVIYELMKKGIDAGIRTINGTIQQYIFPALIIIAVVTVVVGEYSLYRLKNVYKEMKDADEDRFYELDYEEEKWGAWTSGVNLVSQVAKSQKRSLERSAGPVWIFFEVYRIRKIQIFFIRLHYIYTVLFLRYLSFCTLCKSDTGGTSGEKR